MPRVGFESTIPVSEQGHCDRRINRLLCLKLTVQFKIRSAQRVYNNGFT
jgi:hypothetical protein